MREEIFHILKTAGDFVSGEELSRRLDLSRTAIWKHIEGLRKDGYVIESRRHLGYRLVAVPDALHPVQISCGLSTRFLGREMRYFERAPSTMDALKAWAEQGAPEGAVVIAETQTCGRGRLNRLWVSPPGGIWLSVLFRPVMDPTQAANFTLLAGVSTCEAIREIAGLDAGIKWPNDIYFRNQKLAGILTEMKAEIDAIHYIIVGIGINVNLAPGDIPPELRDRATSIYIETGQRVSRVRLVQLLLASLEKWYGIIKTRGAEVVHQRWRELNITLGRKVILRSPGGEVEGIAQDISAEGALLVKEAGGRVVPFYAGDVTLIH